MHHLNERQKASVTWISSPLLVLAGAGSGKTSVITQKIAWLIQECGYQARHIAAVTFTNKAAREMKERVAKLVSGPVAKGLIVATFHNLGLNIIRNEAEKLGLRPGFTIFDQEDARSLIRDLITREYPDTPQEPDELLHQFSAWKNDLLTADQVRRQALTQDELHTAELFERYMAYLRAYNAVDFDDLILLPVQLFRQHPEVLERWQQRIRYLLVDEYQDTNHSQYELVKLLVGLHARFTVVGDDDQSIYAWRGARPENLVRLQKDFPGLKVIKLEQNYRSTARILKAANVLIANNPHVFEKQLWSDFGMGETIRVIRCANEEAETERIVTDIIDQHLKRRAKYKDFAILYRSNHFSRLLEMKLQAYQVPYRLSGGTSFFARAEIKDAMAYLRLAVNPDDDAAFLRVVNVPRREIGPTTLEGLSQCAHAHQLSLFRAINDPDLGEFVRDRGIAHLKDFRDLILDAQKHLEQDDDPVPALRKLFIHVDYEDWLHQTSASPAQAERRMKNVHLLLDQIGRMMEYDPLDDEPLGFEEAINKLVLRDMLDQQSDEDDEDRVQLLTLHASKGLEYPHVFIMGLEEDILPHRNSIESDQVEEERRLMYVGITRARQTLTLTLCAQRKQYGEKIEPTPSRFLDELPQEDLEFEGFGQADPERSKKIARATLDALFEDLGRST
ncbi:MAG: DNA helicase Rep [Gammaproteobacteria bacterium]|nr:MAG: DNA helicase Rep [Gammaproteobacteria bacterium]